MNECRFHKSGSEIQSVDDWFRLAPPKKGILHWKDGRSAKELAKAWFPSEGQPKIPNELVNLMKSHDDTKDAVIDEGIPEHIVALDNFPGEQRNCDLALYGRVGGKPIAISVEAKADEPFDLTIQEKLDRVTNPRSKIPQRIDILCRSLFGKKQQELPEMANLRYQLLTGSAGTLIDAESIGARLAVFVVHIFLSNKLDVKKVDQNEQDFNNFIRLLAKNPQLILEDGKLFGPIVVNGGKFVPSHIPLYVGKMHTRID